MIAECIGYSEKATDPAQRAQGGRESNARLIAASPELLGMLSEAVRLAELGRIMDGETLREAKKIIVRAVQGE